VNEVIEQSLESGVYKTWYDEAIVYSKSLGL
jgi:hypothetical protein